MEETVLAKLKNDSADEKFLLVTADMQAGKMIRTSAPVSEAEIRRYFHDAGMPEEEINSKIAHARSNPC